MSEKPMTDSRIRAARPALRLSAAERVIAQKRLLARAVRAENGCLEWQGGKEHGYGKIYIGKKIKTHRLSYAAFNGNIAAGLSVCHSCDNRKCIEPKHLWLGSNADNIKDAVDKGRIDLSGNGKKGGGQFKLKASDVEYIKKNWRRGVAGIADIQKNGSRWMAKKFGVSRATICKVVSGKLPKSGKRYPND